MMTTRPGKKGAARTLQPIDQNPASNRKPIGKIAALPLAGGGLASLWFLFRAPHDPMMMLGHRYAWMALLALAAIGSIRPRWVRRP